MKINVEAAMRAANPLEGDEQLDQMFGEDLAHYLRIDILNLREGRMTETHQHQPSRKLRASDEPSAISEAKRPRPRVIPTLISFAVVVAAVAAAVLLFRPGGDDVATGVSVGERFLAAREALDAESTMALFAKDAAVADLEVRAVADYEQQYDWYQRLDWVWEPDECTENDSLIGPVVNCTYTHQNAWMKARGVEPAPGSFEIAVVDGLIVELSHDFEVREFSSSWAAFRSWVTANHPDDFDKMYDMSGSFQAPRYTAESLDLWELYTDEYVNSLG